MTKIPNASFPLAHPGDSSTFVRKDFQGRERRDIRGTRRYSCEVSLKGRRERDSRHGGGLHKFGGCNWRPNTFTIQIMEIPRVHVSSVQDVVPAGACTSSMSGFIPRNQSPPPNSPSLLFFSFKRVALTSSLSLSLFVSGSFSLGWMEWKRKKEGRKKHHPPPPHPSKTAQNAGGEAR